jgi:hypothetical protein
VFSIGTRSAQGTLDPKRTSGGAKKRNGTMFQFDTNQSFVSALV